jgi:hypothetical protein
MFNNNGSFLLALFEFFLWFAWFMCLFWIFGDLFRSRDLGGGAKTLWVLFIIVVPFLGILVYLIVRGHGMTERQLEQQKQIQAAQADYIKSVASTTASPSSADQIDVAHSHASGDKTSAPFRGRGAGRGGYCAEPKRRLGGPLLRAV